jgi:hypothetical protein
MGLRSSWPILRHASYKWVYRVTPYLIYFIFHIHWYLGIYFTKKEHYIRMIQPS